MKHITFDQLSRVALGDVGKSIAKAVTRDYYLPDAIYDIYPKYNGKPYKTRAIHFTPRGWMPDFEYGIQFPGLGDSCYDNIYLMAEVKTNNSKLMRDQEKSMARISYGKVTIREYFRELYDKYGNLRNDPEILQDPPPCCKPTDDTYQLSPSIRQIRLEKLAEYKRLVNSNPDGDMGMVLRCHTNYLVIMCHVKIEKNQFVTEIGRVCSNDGEKIGGLDHRREYVLSI